MTLGEKIDVILEQSKKNTNDYFLIRKELADLKADLKIKVVGSFPYKEGYDLVEHPGYGKYTRDYIYLSHEYSREKRPVKPYSLWTALKRWWNQKNEFELVKK